MKSDETMKQKESELSEKLMWGKFATGCASETLSLSLSLLHLIYGETPV